MHGRFLVVRSIEMEISREVVEDLESSAMQRVRERARVGIWTSFTAGERHERPTKVGLGIDRIKREHRRHGHFELPQATHLGSDLVLAANRCLPHAEQPRRR